ncbi:hypothetical protein P2Q00_35945 [Streptomyces coacervatus]|nr:DUF6801 domain-containing protein [Streptomyces coacervatus]MDF2270783.1 hypothetical protein [Streptomyces coacervatus]
MTASVVWPAPAAIGVGQVSPQLKVDATATVGHKVTDSLKLIHAETVEGTADVHAVVAAPGGDITKTVTLTVARTRVPDSGPLTVHAVGVLPPLVFGEPGAASIVVGGIDMHFRSPTATPINSMNGPCDLNSGQDGVLARFTVVSSTTGPRAEGGPAQAAPSPSVPAPPAAASSGWDFTVPLFTLTALLAVIAGVVGLVWWGWTRRRPQNRGG